METQYQGITDNINTIVDERQTPDTLTDQEMNNILDLFGDDGTEIALMTRYTNDFEEDQRPIYRQIVTGLNNVISGDIEDDTEETILDDTREIKIEDEDQEFTEDEYGDFVTRIYNMALNLDSERPYAEATTEQLENNGFTENKINIFKQYLNNLFDNDMQGLIEMFVDDDTMGEWVFQLTPTQRRNLLQDNRLQRVSNMLSSLNNIIVDEIEGEGDGSDDSMGGSLSFKKYKNVNELLKDFDKKERELKGGSVNDVKRYLDKGVTFAKWANKVWDSVQKYPNEKHYPMYVDGKIKMANYMGSGTNLMKRLKDGDEPISFVDGVSQLHDMMYQKAALSGTREEMRAKKREADEEMIKLLNIAKQFKLDNRVNIGMGKIGIKGKMKIEDILPGFITDKLGDEFTGDLEELPEDDVIFLNNQKERVVTELYNKVEQQKQRFQENQPQAEPVGDMQGGELALLMKDYKHRAYGYGLYNI